MSSPYSTSHSIVADFVPTLPSPSNPHSIISSESESSPAISQQTYLSPHSIIPSSDAGLSSPASSSATAATTTTRSPQTVSTEPDHPDSKHHYQTPVIYNAYAANNSNSNLTTVAGSPGLWSQSTDVYYPPPPFQHDDQGQYAKATIQQPQLQQPQQQPQQQQQQQIFQPQYQQQQQYQQYHQQQQPPSAQSFPMYPVGHPNAATTISHHINDPDHHKPPTDTTHMEILGSGQQHQPDKNKSKKKKKKKYICFFIFFLVIIGIVLGVVFGVILKKNNNDGDKPPNPSTSGSSGSSSTTTTTTTATGYYPYPTGMPDMTNCILACQKALTDCTAKCGTNSTCSSECFTMITSCSLGCAGLG